MKTIKLKNRFNGETFTVPAAKSGNWYGSSNRTSAGEPMFEPVPLYRESNPKIDFGDAGGYVASTNQFRTIRDARQFYETRTIGGRVVTWMVRSKK